MSDDMRQCALSNVDSFPERVLMVRMGALRVAIVGRRMHRWGDFFFYARQECCAVDGRRSVCMSFVFHF